MNAGTVDTIAIHRDEAMESFGLGRLSLMNIHRLMQLYSQLEQFLC